MILKRWIKKRVYITKHTVFPQIKVLFGYILSIHNGKRMLNVYHQISNNRICMQNGVFTLFPFLVEDLYEKTNSLEYLHMETNKLISGTCRISLLDLKGISAINRVDSIQAQHLSEIRLSLHL